MLKRISPLTKENNIIPAFTTTIKQDGVNYNVTIAISSEGIPPQGCHSYNASSDWDFTGEPLELEYVVYNMNNKLVDIIIPEEVLKKEYEIYCETNELYVRGF